VIDRLEKAAFVRRFPDPDDRRKVLLRVSGERAAALDAIVAGAAGRDAGDEVVRFLEEQGAALRRETERLRAGQPVGALSSDGTISFAKGALRAARFEVAGGAMDLQVLGAPLAEQLFRAELSGPPVRITEQAGHVRLAHRGFARGKPKGTVQLNDELPWALRVSGGRNRLSFDLTQVRVNEVEVEGGDGKLRFRFGQVEDAVAIRVNGGASEFVFERPASLHVEVVARGRISKLTVGSQERGALAMDTWTSGPADSPGRIRIHVRGGLNKVAIVTV
jgi:hypothetical protein